MKFSMRGSLKFFQKLLKKSDAGVTGVPSRENAPSPPLYLDGTMAAPDNSCSVNIA
jgi:hypothetical protein